MTGLLPRLAVVLASVLLLGASPLAAAPAPFAARPAASLSGSQFVKQVASLHEYDRYAVARDAILAGDVPDFLRELVPVTLDRPPGVHAGPRQVTVFVTPDYLGVGTDGDYLRVPLDFVTAAEVARRLGAWLPTPRIVDAVHAQASVRISPLPLPPDPRMRSLEWTLAHQARLAELPTPRGRGVLVAGAKKDIVLTAQLREQPDRVAIYGWHRADGSPVQPLSLWHGVRYADYSHGVRLVADTVLVDGEPRSFREALSDPLVAPLLSDEGPLPDAVALMRPVIPGSR